MNIESRVRKAVAEQLDIPIERVIPTARFVEDLQVDSLAVIEAIIAVEEEFGTEIPDDATERIVTVQHLIDYLTRRL